MSDDNPTSEYLVTWRIEIDATSRLEAAMKALQIQRDPNSTAVAFEVEEDDPDDAESFDLTSYQATEPYSAVPLNRWELETISKGLQSAIDEKNSYMDAFGDDPDLKEDLAEVAGEIEAISNMKSKIDQHFKIYSEMVDVNQGAHLLQSASVKPSRW